MKLQFNSVWAHPKYNAGIGHVVDVVEEDLVHALLDGNFAVPYVPSAVSEGAKPDAATEARIHFLEAQLADLVDAIRKAGGDPSKAVADAAKTEPGAGPFAHA